MPEDEQPKTAAVTSRSAVIATLLLAVAVVVVAIVMQGFGSDETPTTKPVTEGTAAPDFELSTLAGDAMALSDYSGRPVMINFWASWRPPCREEFPVLADARAAHAGEGFEILGVIRHDSDELSGRFVAESAAEWPMLPDHDSVAWGAYHPPGLPTSYFIDADGVVQRVHIGPVSETQIANHLAAIGLPA